MSTWQLWLGLLFIIVVSLVVRILRQGIDHSTIVELDFAKRPYLLDSNAEYALFKTLERILKGKFYIFPQVSYSHLLKATNHTHFNRITQKSADFVLCDKNHLVPQLVIELDGRTHSLPNRIRRDEFVNKTLESVGLPMLRISTAKLHDEQFIKTELESKLKIKLD